MGAYIYKRNSPRKAVTAVLNGRPVQVATFSFACRDRT